VAGETELGKAVIPIRAALDDLDKDLSAAKEKTEKASSGISGALGKIKWAAVGAGAAALTGTLSDLAREGAADAAGMEVLRVAVENAGESWDQVGGTLDAYMTKMRDLAAIDDSDLKPALASLVAVTGDVEKSMELASLAADLAKGKNMSLSTAAELVGKVAQGNTSILTRYGIVLDDGATATEALGELQRRFAGQAEAYGATTAGQMEIVGLKIGDFRESIGQAMGPAMGFVGMLPGLSSGATMVGGAVGHMLPVLIGLRTTLMTAVIPSIGATIVAMGPILIPIAAIGAAIALLSLAWANDWGGIREKTQIAIDFLTGLFQGFLDTAGPIWDGVQNTIRNSINGIISAINGLIGAWNAIEFHIPGFNIEIPSVDVPGVGRIGGGSLGWGGLTVGTADIGLIPLLSSGGNVIAPGLAVVGERGPELIELPRGAQVTPLSGSQTAFDYDQMAKAIAKQLKPSLNVQTTIVSPEPLSPSRIRHQQETMLRSLALEYGF
jgi:hypothetical protein